VLGPDPRGCGQAPDSRRTAWKIEVRRSAVIGAGDCIGAAIATRFAAEGFTVFAMPPAPDDERCAGATEGSLEPHTHARFAAIDGGMPSHRPLVPEECVRRRCRHGS